MRVISWNMRKKDGNWDYLIENLKPDIALLQETPVINNPEIKKKHPQ